MDELTYRKALDTESRLNKYYADIAANGGPKTSEEAEKAMMNSGVAHIQETGAKAQLLRLQNAQTLARFREANPANVAAPMAPAVAPEPGSFGAAVADRTAADPFRANMMPGAAAAPADRNNLIANLNSRIDANVALGTAQGYKQAEQLRKQVDDLTRLYPVGNTLMGGQGNIIGTAPPVPRQTNLATDLLIPGPNGTMVPNTPLIGVKGQLAVAGRTPRAEALPRTQQVTMRDNTLGIMNMDTGVITPSTLGGAPVKGKPSAFAEKTAAQQKQLGKDLGFAITELTDITKDGGLIDQSTGSGAGRLTDIGAGFFGSATPGAIAIGKIAPIADLALKVVPRFEGPQSDKDTRSYKEAAGQLADSSLPTKIRKEAGKVVLRIMQARKDQFVTTDMATASAPTAKGGVVDFGSLQ